MAKNQLFETIHVTEKMTGKMSGMQSISTCCICNSRCLERIKSNNKACVCAHCYADTLLKMRPNMVNCLTKNGELLSSSILPMQQLPNTNTLYFRFEAFGDLINKTHCINYFNICEKNPQTTFALWTKNPDYIQAAINDGYKKPSNLIIVLSSMLLNVVTACKYDFIDKIFTVYDKDYIAANNIDINCGARNCSTCLQCYKNNSIKYINEKLK